MFLHIGNGVTVRTREIVGIFDLDTASMSSDTRRFLREAEKTGRLKNAADDELPRSFILSKEREKLPFTHLSLLSSAALKLRLLRALEDSEES